MATTTIEQQLNQAEWKPAILVKGETLYNWPFRPKIALKWLKNYLFGPIALIHAGFGLFTWFFLTPSLATMQTFAWDWITLIYLRNVGLLSLVTGSAHFWLYVRMGQGSDFQFNKHGLRENDPRFWFRNQTWENMFFGIVSGCGIWTLYEVLTYWMFANGYMLFPIEWLESPVYTVFLFLLIPHIRAHHFYFTHRLTHWKPLYDAAHYLHHKNTNTGPWSGLSMHPIEHLLYLSGVLLHWVIPSHPIHACFHLLHAGISPTWGHTGFNRIKVNKFEIDTNYFHYLHHRYFECNYGNLDMPWDHLFGTFHDGSQESKKRMGARLREQRKR